MRILFLTAQVPYPPQAGGALRTFGLIDGLHRVGHHIDIMTFAEAGQPDPSSTPLAELCDQIITAELPLRTMQARLRDLLLTGQSDMSPRVYSAEFVTLLLTQLSQAKYDLVHIESLEMATYLPTIRKVQPTLPTIYDSFNAEYDLQRLIFEIDRGTPSRWVGALYSLIQWRRLISFERSVCQKVNRVIAVSEADAEAFRKLAPGVAVHVVPNGIYAADYAHASQQLDLGPAALLFTGTMNYRPNVDAVMWFADDVLEAIRKFVPDTRLFVVGNKPHGRLDGLRQRSDVEITGYVQDILPFLHNAAVYVAPLRVGSGTRLKLLQAMAAGCAIVSTPVGAQGLNVTPGEELMLADNREAFAQATITLLRDPVLRKRMGQAAQRLVCEQYDWSAILPRLLKVYREMGLG